MVVILVGHPLFHAVSPSPGLINLPCALQLQARVSASNAVWAQRVSPDVWPLCCFLFIYVMD